jgi:hypothetical protein
MEGNEDAIMEIPDEVEPVDKIDDKSKTLKGVDLEGIENIVVEVLLIVPD